MTPGPNRVLKIPGSGALVKIETFESGNTFGARFWTDGKREAPMMPDQPWLRRHPTTGEMFWTDECEEIGEESHWEEGGTHADAPFAEEPALEDYLRTLEAGLAANQAKELYIRMRYWWGANDPVRLGGRIAGSEAAYRDNLTRFRSLLDSGDPHQRLMAAEAARELGDFAGAASLLEFSFPEGYSRVVTLIKRLVGEHDARVMQAA
jgi:hypothetical protein